MVTMKKIRIVALLALFLTLESTCAAASWTQDSVDAARTGRSEDDGPRFPDVAFRKQLPGSVYWSAPIILDGAAYVTVTDLTIAGQDLPARGLFRIDLGDANVTKVADLLPPAQRNYTVRASPALLATDGQQFFVVDEANVHALDLDGKTSWTIPLPITPSGSSVALCAPPAVREGKLYVGCSAFVDAPDGALRSTVFVLRISVESGTQDWTWVGALTSAQPPSNRPQAADAANPTYNLQELQSLSVVGDKVLINVLEKAGELFTISNGPGGGSAFGSATGRVGVLALDDSSGRWVWARWSSFQQIYAETPGADPVYVQRDNLPDPGQVTGSDKTVYVKEPGGLVAVNLADGTATSKIVEFGGGNSKRTDTARAMALTDTILYAAKGQSLTAFGLPQLHHEWTLALDSESNETFSSDVRIVAGDTLVASSYHYGGYHEDYVRFGSLYAINATTGQILWKEPLNNTDAQLTAKNSAGLFYHLLPPVGYKVAIADGVLVAASTAGDLLVIGSTPASLKPEIALPDAPLRPGQAFAVDLGATRPGVHGPAEEFRIEWGDGTAEPWTNQTLREHAYPTPGNYTILVQARNAAGQRSTEQRTVAVSEPVREPGLLEVAFTEQNQNLTFFLIGLSLTGGGGFVGFVRMRNKRFRLQDELHGVEAAYERNASNPGTMDAALRERREHARIMLTRGRLDEAQLALVERRIDELRGVVQMNTVLLAEALPPTLRAALDRIIADRRVTPGEKARFLEDVQADPALSVAQKAQIVQRLLT